MFWLLFAQKVSLDWCMYHCHQISPLINLMRPTYTLLHKYCTWKDTVLIADNIHCTTNKFKLIVYSISHPLLMLHDFNLAALKAVYFSPAQWPSSVQNEIAGKSSTSFESISPTDVPLGKPWYLTTQLILWYKVNIKQPPKIVQCKNCLRLCSISYPAFATRSCFRIDDNVT